MLLTPSINRIKIIGWLRIVLYAAFNYGVDESHKKVYDTLFPSSDSKLGPP
jgi:hypothetical protein